jgi:hypothetical protein
VAPGGPAAPGGPTQLTSWSWWIGGELHPTTANVAITASSSGRFAIFSNNIECLMIFTSHVR